MTTAKHLLLAVGLLGGVAFAAPASALPAGPAGIEVAAAPTSQVRMMHGDRMMMRDRMMRKRMMKRRMMKRRMMNRM